ncbi:MAG: hypothetical protein R3E95_15885 [Thiolinea sp.]
MSYGAGVYAQGGMGTEYARGTFLGMGTGEDARSELSLGSVMVPVAYEVNDRLAIGATGEFVWGGLDLKMGLPIMNGNGPTAGSLG